MSVLNCGNSSLPDLKFARLILAAPQQPRRCHSLCSSLLVSVTPVACFCQAVITALRALQRRPEEAHQRCDGQTQKERQAFRDRLLQKQGCKLEEWSVSFGHCLIFLACTGAKNHELSYMLQGEGP